MKRSAFTLFELIIVVALIGIIYAVVLTNFNTKKDVKIIKLQNLKNSLMPIWSKGKRVDLIIYNNCKEAILLLNKEPQNSYKPTIKLSEFKGLKAYKIDEFGDLKEIEFLPILIDEKLYQPCFKFTIYKNGSSSSYILEKDEHYYIFYPYFGDVNQSDDKDEAIEMLTHKQYRGIQIDEVND